jgi:hypothetical protein
MACDSVLVSVMAESCESLMRTSKDATKPNGMQKEEIAYLQAKKKALKK